jgi:hypothetical protein
MTKIMAFRGTEQIESNICIKDRIMEQITTINYFRYNISYRREKDFECKQILSKH